MLSADQQPPSRRLTLAGSRVCQPMWTRHDLSVIDALGIDHPTATAVANDLLDRTTDGYATREVLAHPGCRQLAGNRQRQRLLAVVNDCGLDRGHIPATGPTRLNQLLDTTESAIRRPSDPSAPHRGLMTGIAAR
jgi:hypothetical protein